MTVVNLTQTVDGQRAVLSCDAGVEGEHASTRQLSCGKIFALPHRRAIFAGSGDASAIATFELYLCDEARDDGDLLDVLPSLLRRVAEHCAVSDLRIFAAAWSGEGVDAAIYCGSRGFQALPVRGTTAGQPNLAHKDADILRGFSASERGIDVERFHRTLLARQAAEIRQGHHGADRHARGPYTVATIDPTGITSRIYDEAELLEPAARTA